MPELPEVEVIRNGIATCLIAQRVERVIVRTARLRWPIPPQLGLLMTGEIIQDVGRRGKYLYVECSQGYLLIHLGMTGTLRIWPRHAQAVTDRHDHVDWIFEDCLLRFRDPRRFGALLWHPRNAGDILLHPRLSSIGVEPLSAAFHGVHLYQHTRARQISIKQALLSGKIVAGVGNIYACESLFRAGIHPAKTAARISAPRYIKLAGAIRATLAEAIEKGGSTLRDFKDSFGEGGCFQLDCFVYGRAGRLCRQCGAVIRRIVQCQRVTYYCPRCQRF
ncbi:Formamidopyrimidine-DNA glycosylase (Fapy-DNA glycosylase) [Candidatus Glomeribacter gigasporarum BEG34]|uniref:Formamidopyrimidine-DNA glycosylase n=1 Tax=Candidatus Glomeribacter gigasporarum BEG34 TaxID=1070319 RepID=G2J947_9BURK|nr:bifunctional DNA-formamidopyrimidine glycosylase/DNA-(apurinic or apyrimidinic site) lyase [Candidatus Glomeribacter gigasporarum]CCD29294.1 Formamidopyrimidine-DNA glycosylase (Fapy-DNA glycosylase) [Candidatus Glomeribacter gigasporarum BEG34]